jgi:diguanylate cyclase (GGDEF)-like protein
MHPASLAVFANELKDTTLPAGATFAQLYYFHNDQWYSVTGASPNAKDSALLEAARHHTVAKNASRTRLAVYMAEPRCAVAINCSRNYQQQTVDRIQRAIERTYRAGQNAYAARYNTSTGLINKNRFSELLRAALAPPGHVHNRDSSLLTPDLLPKRVAVCAIDIDFFKQVNDNYGHSYGDLVLKALAARLSRHAADIAQSGSLSIDVAHLSGEEFALLLIGHFKESDLLDHANAFVQCVSEESMPSEEELASLVSSTFDRSSLPPEYLRHVTISAGLAGSSVGYATESPELISDRLLKQADIAMYRSKAAGRNRLTAFDDIMSRHGTVIEVDRHTGFVVIDIGSLVGVKLGQEFKVFHPKFTGKQKLVVSDGRTDRPIGVYPRKATATIVAVDVQQDVSFCMIVENERVVEVESGSELEAIPLGTISRPEASIGPSDSPGLVSLEELSRHLIATRESAAPAVAMVITLRNVSDLIQRFGNFEVNRELTTAYEAISKAIPLGSLIAKVGPTELAISGYFDVNSVVSEIVEYLNETPNRHGQLSIGVFDRTLYAKEQQENTFDQSEIVAEADVELARYAAANAPKPDVATYFTPNFVNVFLGDARLAGRNLDTLSDFRRLTNLGIRNGYAYNHAALAMDVLETQEPAAILANLRAATSLLPSDSIVAANQAAMISRYTQDQAAAVDGFAAAIRLGFSFESDLYAQFLFGAIRQARSRFNELDEDTKAAMRRGLEFVNSERLLPYARAALRDILSSDTTATQ